MEDQPGLGAVGPILPSAEDLDTVVTESQQKQPSPESPYVKAEPEAPKTDFERQHELINHVGKH